jgi:hypothetical protein
VSAPGRSLVQRSALTASLRAGHADAKPLERWNGLVAGVNAAGGASGLHDGVEGAQRAHHRAHWAVGDADLNSQHVETLDVPLSAGGAFGRLRDRIRRGPIYSAFCSSARLPAPLRREVARLVVSWRRGGVGGRASGAPSLSARPGARCVGALDAVVRTRRSASQPHTRAPSHFCAIDRSRVSLAEQLPARQADKRRRGGARPVGRPPALACRTPRSPRSA